MDVQLAGGQWITGAIDPLSTAERLVLRREGPGITLRRSIAWERIAAARLGGQPLAVAELRRQIASPGQPAPDVAAAASANAAALTPQRGRVLALRNAGRDLGGPLPSPDTLPAAPGPTAAMLSLDAYVANWDADVELDGIVVELAPHSDAGELVPVSATAEIELFAPQRHVFHHAPRSGGDTLELAERWTRAIGPADYGPAGVRLRLPFGAMHPELDPDWLAWWYGLVHVKLAVPGHGILEASRDGVRLRPWAPNRDQLEMNAGRRFVPTEGLGRRQ